MKSGVRYPLTVYYDASCPMCESQMQALKSRDTHDRLRLVDCSAAEFDDSVLAGLAIARKDLMTLLHVRDADGRWSAGVEAFEHAYRAVGRERLAGWWGSRKLRPLLNRLYPWIARHRQRLSRLRLR